VALEPAPIQLKASKQITSVPRKLTDFGFMRVFWGRVVQKSAK